MPILGPAKSVSGLWFAEAVWVTHSAGVGRAVAEWLVTGRSSVDLHECEIARFDAGQLAPAWIKARSCQNFVEVYDIIHPQQPIIDPRPLKVSPFYGRQQALGGEFLEAGGWERPHWYGANAGLVTGDEPAPNEWAAKYWSPIIAAEARVTRESVAVYDMTALRRIEVFGRDAEDFLHRVSTNNLHRKTGAVVYTLLLDNEGGVRSDVTVAKLGDTKFQLGVNTPSDQDWLERQIGRDEQVFLRDITDATCCIGLWGPKARDVVASISTIDFSHENFGYFTARTGFIGEVPVTALRLSYVGELGWELYADAAYGQRLWDVLFAAGAEHGIIAAGRGAFNSLRLEKGYRSAGADMTTEHDAVSSGLNFAVRKDKKAESTPTRVLAALVNPDPKAAVLGKEPVYHDGEAVGYVTSASFGYTIDKSIAYAWIPVELSAPDTVVEIEYFGTRLAYTVAEDPLYDPKMTRIRR
jgi:glycine cleavage system aminomethyltransferase T